MDLAYALSLAASLSSGDERIAYNFRAEEYRRKALEEGGQSARIYGIERSIRRSIMFPMLGRAATIRIAKRMSTVFAKRRKSRASRSFGIRRLCSTGGVISDFMRQIGEGDRVFIFLSDKYLRSPYCMFELFELWRNSRQNKDEFLRRVRFFTIDGTKSKNPANGSVMQNFGKGNAKNYDKRSTRLD